MDLPTIFDAAILIWLIGTWFYEGHHKRCEVEITCPTCGGASTTTCTAGHQPREPLPVPRWAMAHMQQWAESMARGWTEQEGWAVQSGDARTAAYNRGMADAYREVARRHAKCLAESEPES